MNTYSKLIVFIVILIVSLNASDVDLSGIVSDVADNPIQGVEVYLKGMGLKDTTDASGKYNITGIVSGIALHSPSQLAGGISLRRTIVEFTSDIPQNVQIRIFTPSGKSISVQTYSAIKGINKFHLQLSKLIEGVYFISVSAESTDLKVFRYCHTARGRSKYAEGSAVTYKPGDLFRQSYVNLDTLVFTYQGYASECVQINNYTGIYNAVLKELPDDLPKIITQPRSLNSYIGKNATFRIKTNGHPVPSLQWIKNGIKIPGAIDTILRLTNLQFSDSGSYQVIATNRNGADTSEIARLCVYGPPVLLKAPKSISLLTSDTAFFTAEVIGYGLTYSLVRSGFVRERSNTLPVKLYDMTLADSGKYTLEVSNGAGTVVSDTFVIQLSKIEFTIQPNFILRKEWLNSKDALLPVTISFSYKAFPDATIQWIYNGKAIAGAHDTILNVNNFAIEDTGAYTVVIKSRDGSMVCPARLFFAPKMILIPAKDSIFVMGAEASAHQVTLTTDYYMSITETTGKEYGELMNATYPDFRTKTFWGNNFGYGNNCPAGYVSWFDAVLYCNALSKRFLLDTVYSYSSINGVIGGPINDGYLGWEFNKCSLIDIRANLSANGYRLPTEAQWEYACRAGTITSTYWGDKPANDYISIPINGDYSAEPVAQHLPNAFGLYDMIGSVQEWCNDWYTKLSDLPQTDPLGPDTGYYRVLRGGYTGQNSIFLTSTFRYDEGPVVAGKSFGFRVALPVR